MNEGVTSGMVEQLTECNSSSSSPGLLLQWPGSLKPLCRGLADASQMLTFIHITGMQV